MSAASDVAFNTLAAAIGCIVGVLFERSLPDRGSGTVVVGDNNVVGNTIRTDVDNRQYLTIEVTRELREAARTDSKLAPKAPKESPSSGSNDDWWVTPLIVFLVVVLLAGLYMKYQTQVIEALVGLTVASLAFLISAIALAARRKVRFSVGIRIENIVALVVALSTFLDAYYLRHPPFFHGNGGFDELVAFGRSNGLTPFIDHYGPKGLFFIIYQLVGIAVAVWVLALAVFAAARTLALISTVKRRRAGRIATALIGGGANPPWPSIYASVVAVVAILLTTGAVYSWVPSGGQVSVPGVNSTPTPSPPRTSVTPSLHPVKTPTTRPKTSSRHRPTHTRSP